MNFQTASKTKISQLFTAFAVTLVLAACSQGQIDTPPTKIVQAVKLSQVSEIPQQTRRTFPAEVSAVKTVDVSFEVSGRMVQEHLPAGTLVKQGQLLAEIDPTPFIQRQQEAEARLTQANRDLVRIESTFANGLSTQAELDDARTNQELAQIALNKANQDLSYTRITAPFDAQVSERLVENDSYVRAGDSIARLQDVSRFYFNINVPERLLSRYQDDVSVVAQASIISAPERKYKLQYVEHDTTPDPITQTYKVVFATDAQNTHLTPGARAIVEVTLGDQAHVDGLLLPFSALQGNDSAGFHVWKYNQATSQVGRVDVRVMHIENQAALVVGNLTFDDYVVAAGVSKMREGLEVKAYQPER